MDFDDVFTTPEVESEETQAFEVLREAAHERVRAMEEDIYSEVEGRYELHRMRLGDIDVDRLIRAGTSGPSATASAPTSQKLPQYKPVEVFLSSKTFPWWKISDTVARAEDLEALSDYLYSGGLFNDIEQPIMYMKKILDKDSLISFRAALNLRINRDKANPIIKLLVETLKDMI